MQLERYPKRMRSTEKKTDGARLAHRTLMLLLPLSWGFQRSQAIRYGALISPCSKNFLKGSTLHTAFRCVRGAWSFRQI